jgi:hypothetical protein
MQPQKQQPPAKRRRFDLAARMAVTKTTQRKYGELRAAAPEGAAGGVPGRVPLSRLQHTRAQIAQALRDVRALAAEYDHHGSTGGGGEGAVLEVEVRLGKFLSKQTGTRFDYGKGLYALPSSVGVVTDMSFEAGVAQEHFERVQGTLDRATELGRLACHASTEEVYIYDMPEQRTVSKRLFVESSTLTPLAMQRKEALRDVDASIFMPPPLSPCDARLGLSLETPFPPEQLPRSVPSGWGRRRRRQRRSYSVAPTAAAAAGGGGAATATAAAAAAAWRVDLTAVTSWDDRGKQTRTFEVELELEPEVREPGWNGGVTQAGPPCAAPPTHTRAAGVFVS